MLDTTLDREKYVLEYATERSGAKVELLLVLLEAKFGALPQNYVDKLRDADTDTVHKWAINVLHAQSLAAVFI